MGKQDKPNPESTLLRQKAEEKLRQRPAKTPLELYEANDLKLIHELEVHQIELEMQNEELASAISAARDAITLYDFAPAGYFTLSKSGEILKLNLSGAAMLGKVRSKLENSLFYAYVSEDSKPAFRLFLQEVFNRVGTTSCEVVLAIHDKRPLTIFITGKSIANEEQCLITVVDITERKRAEEALIEKDSRLELAMKAASFSWWEMDITSGNITFGKLKAEILGYPPEKFRHYTDFMDLVHPDDYEKAMNAMHAHISGEKGNYEVEYRIATRLGEYKWFYDIGSIVKRTADGRPLSIAGLAIDITGRKLAEDTLNLGNMRHQAILKTAMDGFWLADSKGNLLEVNETYCRMSGYCEQELLSMHISDLEANETREDIAERIKIIAERGESRFESRHRRKDGSLWEVEVSAQFQAVGDGGSITFIHDISERKRAEKELRIAKEKAEENEVYLGTVLQSLSDVIVSRDLNNNTVFFNKAFNDVTMELFHQPASVGMNTLNLLPEENRHIWEDILEKVKKGEKNTEEYAYQSSNNKYDYITSHIPIIQDSKIIGTLEVTKDITIFKNREVELKLAKKHAEESDRLKTAFLSNISHEIRTPMNGILGFAELLKKPDLTGEQQLDYIRIIKKSSDRMLNTINNIVDISKIESGQVKLTLSETNINEQLEFICNFFKPETDKKGIAFSYNAGLLNSLANIVTDRPKVYAILTSLLSNAIKYTEKGRIKIGYDIVAIEPLNATDLELQFYVKDTGIGVPDDRRQAIFERFIQADISDSRAFQGAGLGLSISKAYVEMLGGRIWVECDANAEAAGSKGEGQGSSFYFTIPYIAATNQKTATENTIKAVDAEKAGKKLKVLIVDDDEVSELLISIACKPFSYEIIRVNNGNEAVEACRNQPDIDMVMMDIKLPEMDGYQATRQIRHFNGKVVIIAQTAFGMTGDREKALEAGCNDYIPKPINLALVRKMIHKYCYE